MRPVQELSAGECRAVRYVLCDIDDTLTWEGRLLPIAFEALDRLRQAGLVVLPVTGRSAGWCDQIARLWPVAGVVGENGALHFSYDRTQRRMKRRYWRSEEQRQADRALLGRVAQRVLDEVPGARIAADQAYRETDLAIDYCEDVPALSVEEVARIVDVFESSQAIAKVSSIHVNGWFGDYDKLSMGLRVLRDDFAFEPASDLATVAYVGDSPNDGPMFGYFPHAVGVANIRTFEKYAFPRPRWVTQGQGGVGFAEFADHLLESRS